MDHPIQSLEPRGLWEIFHQITQIPRPSYHEERIQEFVMGFGRSLGLETQKDQAGNIIIRKPATAGMENRKGVILQGHLDMVPQKNNNKAHNFVNDPIETRVEGEWVMANGTTLGADNGIGVSAALAVLASRTVVHGPLEALFTATEETGMDGAKGLKPGILKGSILLNMDSEDEGELYVGCAGGEDVNVRFVYTAEEVPAGNRAFSLEVTGLKGGHSGMDIILQRGNANKVFFRLLNQAYRKAGARLARIEGGSLRNAIPREAVGIVTVDPAQASMLKLTLEEEFRLISDELSAREPDMKMILAETELPAKAMDELTQVKLTASIMACPNGVIRMSDSMPGLVETSSNMAVVKSDVHAGTVDLSFLMRSSVDSARADLGHRLQALFGLAGADISLTGGYPGWKPNMESPVLKTMVQVYEKNYGKTPEIKAIHAGLECGILAGAYPGWDMISFGPTIRFPHSPDEKVHVPSVKKFWDYLLETLKSIPVR